MNRFDSWPFHCRSVFVAHLENLMPPVKVLKKAFYVFRQKSCYRRVND